MLLDKLAGIAARFDEVSRLITEPDIVNDMKRYVQLNKEYKELTKVVAFYNEYKNVTENIESAKRLLEVEKDEEMREIGQGRARSPDQSLE
jgi:peptide chain release factor 1